MIRAAWLARLGLTSGQLRFLLTVLAALLANLTAPSPAPAFQWLFDPSGYLYPKAGAPGNLDHVTIQWSDLPGYRPQPQGLYAAGGAAYRFASLKIAGNKDHPLIPFEFTTAVINERYYRFTGEFHNSHVYEECVTNPEEIVASGRLWLYQGGKLRWEGQVQLVYSGKLRAAMSDVNVPYPSGTTDLMIAARKGELVKVRELLAAGANANATARFGRTALKWALDGSTPSTAMVEALIKAGVDVDLADDSGTTPLMVAVDRNSSGVVELLIAAGANVNAISGSGLTPLIDAVLSVTTGTGSRESVSALLRAGADVNAKDHNGRTGLSIARAAHDDETVAILLQAGAKD